MAGDKRLGAVFVSGLLLGAAAVARARKQTDAAPSPADPVAPVAPAIPVAPAAPAPLLDVPKVTIPPPKPAVAPPGIKFPRTLPEFEFAPVEPRLDSPPLQPTPPKPRFLIIFASFFVFIAVVLVGAWMGFGSGFFSLDDKFATANSTSKSIESDGLPLNTCPLQPVIAAAGINDGQFPLQVDVSGLTATDMGSFLVIGRQSAAAGRPRDAEVAFLMACRVADKVKGNSSIESADARYQLGAHYGALALTVPAAPGSVKAELLQRAEGLYADSLPAYIAKYGQSGDKPKMSNEALSAVRLAMAQPQSASSAKSVFESMPIQAAATSAPEPVTQASEAAFPPRLAVIPKTPQSQSQSQFRRGESARAAVDAPPASQAPESSRNGGPSFDCRRARSNTEKMICADSELARLDRELGRAYGRAKNVAADPAAFRRQTEAEWYLRETMCQDRGCLLRWYAYRRIQLVSVIEGRQPVSPGDLR